MFPHPLPQLSARFSVSHSASWLYGTIGSFRLRGHWKTRAKMPVLFDRADEEVQNERACSRRRKYVALLR
jgi:hypothetical protein